LGYTNVRVLYKTHPEFKAQLGDECRLNHVHVMSDISIEKLLRECNAVVTRNSTLGFEGLLFGKRCITLGDSIYSGLGLTDDVESTNQLTEVVARVYESAQMPDSHEMKLVHLVSRLHQFHHYFVEPGTDEKKINHALVDKILREAGTPVPEGTLMEEYWMSVSWKVRIDEYLWDLRLRYRDIKKIFVKGSGSR
jgi:capsule polysaccharide export protein KpsC/LpsZ